MSGKRADEQPFFAGAHVYERMDRVRTAINEIRRTWDRYPEFMTELRALFDDGSLGDSDPVSSGRLEALFSAQKDWDTADPTDEYSAIALYSSEVGYRQMFRAINTAFRTPSLPENSTLLRSATFLVELLNIDLFHFRERNQHADNFTGTVYRGMSLPQNVLDRFAETMRRPVTERYLSIPSAMASATPDRKVAMSFASAEAERQPDRHLALWEIDVRNLDPRLLDLYRSRFPSSVVTSLCAVPIAGISDFPGEKEVLLRGPFFQIVGLSAEDLTVSGRPVHKIEAVMHNTNRDHLTAIASNVGADKEERELFKALVLSDRFDICARLAEQRRQASDANEYRSRLAEQQAVLSPYE
ncbi:MAG TPA: hypothetical protein VLK89_08620 [Solirubrobacterales bacterium]|nr:hypothetical protein [Solirubrobacterales bacterium]